MQPIQGLHHVTAIASDPQANINFYQGVLGQRLVKTTVNFDDPGAYHFYFADATGTPGTVLTFFPWPHVKRGEPGNGETAAVAYRVGPESLAYWRDRLAGFGVTVAEIGGRFGAAGLAFRDPDGMRVELIADEGAAGVVEWANGPVPLPHALRGFHSVTLWLDAVEPTARLLVDELGYVEAGREGERTRYKAAADNVGLYVDIIHRQGQPRGRFGGGSIHHIAFRTVDDSEQLEYLSRLRGAGYGVTPVQDRQYFRSIYFRSPGGVLFEIATDGPGFLYDESPEELGQTLRLPDWYEPRRSEIEAALPPIRRTLPDGVA